MSDKHPKIIRPVVDTIITDAVIDMLRESLKARTEKHGPGVFSGPHEAYGILFEEMSELCDAMRKNDWKDFGGELLDIAVGCIFGIASLITLSKEDLTP